MTGGAPSVGGMPSTVGGAGGAPIVAGAGGSLSSAGGTASFGGSNPSPTAVGTLGEACAPNAAHACAGLAQKSLLICTDGKWSSNSACSADRNCDTSPTNTGLCSPRVPACVGKKAGAQLCEGQNVIACGADLVSTTPVTTCVNQACVSGACVGMCTPGATRCANDGLQTCDANGEFKATACPGATPVCSNGMCVSAPSCSGLATTCGTGALDHNCCATSTVTGGTFNRGSDVNYPAMVSEFRLDNYEVTVGRFRKFVAAYSQNIIPTGAGKNWNNPSDPGWEAGWTTLLPVDRAALIVSLKSCTAKYTTWTDSPSTNENRPVNCVDWYQSEAFCMWDGGRLPTEAEWNYASAGGIEDRTHAWGEDAVNATRAVYNCNFGATPYTCTGVDNIAPVGSLPLGNGKWGQSDLAGNIKEWTQDWFRTYVVPCKDWANLLMADSKARAQRSGYFDGTSTNFGKTSRTGVGPSSLPFGYEFGMRCARPL